MGETRRCEVFLSPYRVRVLTFESNIAESDFFFASIKAGAPSTRPSMSVAMCMADIVPCVAQSRVVQPVSVDEKEFLDYINSIATSVPFFRRCHLSSQSLITVRSSGAQRGKLSPPQASIERQVSIQDPLAASASLSTSSISDTTHPSGPRPNYGSPPAASQAAFHPLNTATMPKAEVGSTKYIANKMKAKGLQRLRWYCQICEKQCRDENGFKQHTQSEGHVRAMLMVGEDPKKYINEYSSQFQRDFLQLLKTSHGEKKVHLNNFYQEYIREKEHIHMNATKWPSLTEFAKHLGREGVCRVEEGDRGLEVQFIDDSPEAVRRREDVKRKEKQMKGDEDMEARTLERQIKQAREAAEKAGKLNDQKPRDEVDATPAEPVKVSLNLSGKAAQKTEQPKQQTEDAPVEISTFSSAGTALKPESAVETAAKTDADVEEKDASTAPTDPKPAAAPKMSMSLSGNKPKHVNPLMKKNPLSKKSEKVVAEPEKKMSNAERIMREEMERKRKADERYGSGGKRQRLGA